LNETGDDEQKVQAQTVDGETNTENSIGISSAPDFVQSIVARVGWFNDLKDKWKHSRLNNALIKFKSHQRTST